MYCGTFNVVMFCNVCGFFFMNLYVDFILIHPLFFVVVTIYFLKRNYFIGSKEQT